MPASTIDALLADLAAAGVDLSVMDGRLRFRRGPGTPDDLINRLRDRRAELLAAIVPEVRKDEAFGPGARRARLLEDVQLWPAAARKLYHDSLAAAGQLGHPTEVGSAAESAARETAEVAASWHRGWPRRRRRQP